MKIRKAEKKDIPALGELLSEVLEIHHEQRPDLFRSNVRKYTDTELEEMLLQPEKPVFVAADEKDTVLGYAFCVVKDTAGNPIFTQRRELYLDDLCVRECCRGQGVGKALYEFVLAFAKEEGCYDVTLNVWGKNEAAIRFYQNCGMQIQKIGMETIL